MVSQNSATKSSSQSPSCKRVGLGGLAARQLQHIVDDGADALGVVANDVGQTALIGSDAARFRRAVGRHGSSRRPGLRISWAMLAESRAERGKFALLHALGHQAGVLEENQRGARRRAAERREVRLNHACAVGCHETRGRILACVRAAAKSTGSTAGAAIPRRPVRPGRRDRRREFPPPTR